MPVIMLPDSRAKYLARCAGVTSMATMIGQRLPVRLQRRPARRKQGVPRLQRRRKPRAVHDAALRLLHALQQAHGADGSKVDRGLMQRQFNGWLKKAGSLSGRMLDVAADYDRRFVLVDSAIGNQIDDALSWLSEMARNAPKGDSA